ncbi:copper resistance protein CopC [Dactylosporangium sp. AC04546]|uniref:copper resistance CopC family protein n=1 Tax=Dactylosporangium sp. AC04546 TaxID=2862460 RepID=UPI001EE10A11|nr:copper resistance CopC family protein [Dactylosporangium sp. AC04546]WVK80389.1 copper resistance protein CopC [Dactylosporangium sp. AC04546]
MRLPVTLRATLAAAAAGLLVLLVPAQPAWAHAKLVKTDPADGATVGAPLAAVTFTFNEMVKQQFSTVVVTGADGVSYSDGAPKSVDKTLTQPVKPLPNGAVRVAWRTVSVDGHPIEGQFTFTNAAAAPTSAAPSSPPPSATTAPAGTVSSAAPTLAADPASDDSGSGGVVWLVLGGVAVVLVLVGGVVWWRRRSVAG